MSDSPKIVQRAIKLVLILVSLFPIFASAQSKADAVAKVCGISLGMDQMAVITTVQRSGLGHLEPKFGYPAYDALPAPNRPLLISYDENLQVEWLSGPSIRTGNGIVLNSTDSLEAIREKLGERLSKVTDSRKTSLCDGSVEGYLMRPNILISVLANGELVLSLGPLDGWEVARKHGVTWEQLQDM